MSCIFAFLGQAGNQIGHEFMKLLNGEKTARKSKGFFDTYFNTASSKAHVVMVDAEPKVIKASLDDERQSKLSLYDPRNVVYSESGCGNNWALGYNFKGKVKNLTSNISLTESNTLVDETMERIRREVESCDVVQAIFVFHSMGGGTGSGLGSRVVEEIRIKYPSYYIFTISIAPFQHGETPLQHYNCLLTLNHIQQYADGVFLFVNDDLLRSITKNMKRQNAGHSTLMDVSYSVSDINKYISSSLCGLLLPVYSKETKLYTPFDAFSLVNQVVPMKDVNFVELHTSALLTHNATQFTSWQYIAEDLTRHVPIYDLENSNIKTIYAKAVVRGGLQTSHDVDIIKNVLQKQAFSPVDWTKGRKEEFHTLVSSDEALKSYKLPYSLTVCANRTSFMQLFNRVLTKSYTMMQSRAYINWYQRHGLEITDFEEAICNLQNVVDNYVELI
ncbi:hypothetical protein FDP41_000112 [Naegleria fowleri]|uniref:Tubulin/FtsZ GTPase domain-containing protein n=1 Tax=Naegleria fowleri TaxID=5763 RepID=A0A6A5C3U0_NAEFO|nr:uncharacterized protein FDP41_000112 [Naegleria fowleri]KAF0985073.1 hypothetical protein FDP41_000112 [Naegleria fowleri]